MMTKDEWQDNVSKIVRKLIELCLTLGISQDPWRWSTEETNEVLRLLCEHCYLKPHHKSYFEKYSLRLSGYQLCRAVLSTPVVDKLPKKIGTLLKQTVLPMAVKAVVEPEIKKNESENTPDLLFTEEKSENEINAHVTDEDKTSVGNRDDEHSEENYESEIPDDDLDFEDISDIDSSSDREDEEFEQETSPPQVKYELTKKVESKSGGMIDKINAIENDLKKFQEKLSQYDQDINSLQIVAGAARGLDGFCPNNAESDDDGGTRWIDTGHGLLPFIQSCLQDARYSNVVRWIVVNKQFEILDLARLAEMWGREKKKDGMTKRKLNRSLSYLIKTKNKLIKSPSNKSVYTIVSSNASKVTGLRAANDDKFAGCALRRTVEKKPAVGTRRDSTSSHDSNTSFDVKPTMNARDMKDLLEKASVVNGKSKDLESVVMNVRKIPTRKRTAQSTPVSPMLSRDDTSRLPTMNDVSANSDLFCLSRDSKMQKLSCGIFQKKISSYSRKDQATSFDGNHGNHKDTSRQSNFNSGGLYAWNLSNEQPLQTTCTNMTPFLFSNSLYSNAQKNCHDNALPTNGMIANPDMQFPTLLLDQVATSFRESSNASVFPTNDSIKIGECEGMTQWNQFRTDICGLLSNSHQSNGFDFSNGQSPRCYQDLSSIMPVVLPMADNTSKFTDLRGANDDMFEICAQRGPVEKNMDDDVDDAVLDKYLERFHYNE